MENGKGQKNILFFVGLVLIMSFFWGISFFFINEALKYMDSFQLLQARWSVSAAVFIVLILLGRVRIDFKNPDLKFLALATAIMPCSYAIFETFGIKNTSVSESAIFIAGIPASTLIIGILFLHKKASPRAVLSIVLSFAGILICTVFSPAFSLGGSKLIGYILLFVSVLLGGLYGHVCARTGKSYDPMAVTASMSLAGLIFFNAICLASGRGFSALKICVEVPSAGFACLILGVLCSAICYIIYNFVMARVENTAMMANVDCCWTTTVGMLAGILFSGDPWGLYTVCGLGLTIFGLILSSKEA